MAMGCDGMEINDDGQLRRPRQQTATAAATMAATMRRRHGSRDGDAAAAIATPAQHTRPPTCPLICPHARTSIMIRPPAAWHHLRHRPRTPVHPLRPHPSVRLHTLPHPPACAHACSHGFSRHKCILGAPQHLGPLDKTLSCIYYHNSLYRCTNACCIQDLKNGRVTDENKVGKYYYSGAGSFISGCAGLSGPMPSASA
ncbi:hypothetical protein BC827DRAFT_1231124 [Russula dissimulans]|nr:hypothetical protein BC827DRAFT_1231124 [Russula dissimulans]